MPPQISQQIPLAFDSFQRKYNQLIPQFGPEALGPLMQLDYNRVIRGAYPIPLNRTADILQAVQTGQTQYQKKPKSGPLGIFERVGEDLGQFARALPGLPGQLIKEVKAL